MQVFSRIFLIPAVLIAAALLAGLPPRRPPERARSQLLPLAAWQKEFQIIEGKDRGRVVPFVLQHDPADEKQWKLILGDYARIALRSGPDGALMMERLDLITSKNDIVYEPALPVLPAVPHSGAAMLRQTGYKMYSLETGKLKRAGRVTHLVKRISPSQFNTPAGVLDGYYVEIEHGMEMEYYSRLQISLGLGCRLDEGPVYGAGRYKVTKLGVFTETKTAAAALAKR